MRRILLALALLIPALALAQTCGNGYSYLKLLVISHNSVPNTDQTNFPVLACFNGACTNSIPLADIKTVANGGHVQNTANNSISVSGPADMVFCTARSGGTALKYEVATYTATTGAMEAWIEIPTLSHTTDTNVWMFYGNASVSTTQQDLSMWSDAGYVYVNHFADGTTLNVTNSTGSPTASNSGATATTGKVDGAAAFVAASSQSVNAGGFLNYSTVTMEMWSYPTSGGVLRVVSNWDSPTNSNGYEFFLNGNTFMQWGSGGTNAFVNASALPQNAWSYLVGVINGTSGSVYINGTASGSQTGSGTAGSVSHNMEIGHYSGGNYYNGRLDEVRFSNSAKSADWINTAYNNQSAPAGFVLVVDASNPSGMTSGAYCIPVTIDHTKIPNTDQTNFPLLVRGIYSWMATVANGGFSANASGYDIRWFSDSSCTSALDFQRVYWTATTGDSAWRVRVPTASHTADTTIYVKIGNASDNTDQSTLWMGSYNYIGVYNGGSPSSLDPSDSGSAGLTFTCGASVNPVLTPVGGGFFLGDTYTDDSTCGWTPTGTDSIGAHGYPTGSAVGHIRMLVQMNANTFARMAVSPNDAAPGGYGKANTNGARDFEFEDRSTEITGMTVGTLESGSASIAVLNSGSTPTYSLDTGWHWLDFDYPTAGGDLTTSSFAFDGVCASAPFYFSSTSVLNTSNAPAPANQAEIRIGRLAAHGVSYFTGNVAQFETSSVSRSCDNVAARYNNESSIIYSLGTASPVSSGSTVKHKIVRH